MTKITECVACGSSQWDPVEEWHGFQIVSCRECGLSFTLNPSYRPERYRDAYEGEGDLPVPEEHAYVYIAPGERLFLESVAFVVPPPRLTPAERTALAWIEGNAPKGATVIDCGCGSGRFLRALKRRGFRGVGVEISQSVVDALNRTGLTAISGKSPDFEWNGEPPFAITFFEVLEHIPQPMDMLTILHERFPTAAILASVPSPNCPGLLLKGERSLSDYPPNHFLRWTPEALKHAFRRAGYRYVEVILPSPVGSEVLPGLGQLVYKLHRKRRKGYSSNVIRETRSCGVRLMARFKATVALWVLWLYQHSADIVGSHRAWVARRRRASAASMLAIAKP